MGHPPARERAKKSFWAGTEIAFASWAGGGRSLKVAVALFGERISPHFASAPELLVLVLEEGKVHFSAKVNTGGMSSRERVLKLVSLGVDVLVCGGISRGVQMELERKGIKVLANMEGDPMSVVFSLGDHGDKGSQEGPRNQGGLKG